MKKRLHPQGCAHALWRRTAGHVGTLLVTMLLWLTATQTMADDINGLAVYDKTTGVLTFDIWNSYSDPWPVQKENYEVYILWDSAVVGTDWFYPLAGKSVAQFEWSETTRQATRVVFKEGFKKYNTLPTCHAMFQGFEQLQTIEGLEYLTIHEGITDMSCMFADCKQLKQVDMSNLDVSKATDMNSMFLFCEQLETVNLTGFKTRDVQDLSNMFFWCRNLKHLDLSGFNTAKVTNMCGMFCGCESLTELDLSSFNTEQVTNMAHLFNSCSSLTALDLSKFNTARVTNMDQMFPSCSSLTALDLSSFNTALVTNMGVMFWNCTSLTALDLSSFNTSKVTDMHSMFNYCTALRDIYVGDGFSTASAWSSDNMFHSCQNLPGYDDSRKDKTNAHWRDGGYFQKVVGRVSDRKIGARGDELTAARVSLSDGEDLEVYEHFTAAELTYTRTMDDQQWQAAYLPFTVTAEGMPLPFIHIF